MLAGYGRPQQQQQDLGGLQGLQQHYAPSSHQQQHYRQQQQHVSQHAAFEHLDRPASDQQQHQQQQQEQQQSSKKQRRKLFAADSPLSSPNNSPAALVGAFSSDRPMPSHAERLLAAAVAEQAAAKSARAAAAADGVLSGFKGAAAGSGQLSPPLVAGSLRTPGKLVAVQQQGHWTSQVPACNAAPSPSRLQTTLSDVAWSPSKQMQPHSLDWQQQPRRIASPRLEAALRKSRAGAAASPAAATDVVGKNAPSSSLHCWSPYCGSGPSLSNGLPAKRSGQCTQQEQAEWRQPYQQQQEQQCQQPEQQQQVSPPGSPIRQQLQLQQQRQQAALQQLLQLASQLAVKRNLGSPRQPVYAEADTKQVPATHSGAAGGWGRNGGGGLDVKQLLGGINEQEQVKLLSACEELQGLLSPLLRLLGSPKGVEFHQGAQLATNGVAGASAAGAGAGSRLYAVKQSPGAVSLEQDRAGLGDGSCLVAAGEGVEQRDVAAMVGSGMRETFVQDSSRGSGQENLRSRGSAAQGHSSSGSSKSSRSSSGSKGRAGRSRRRWQLQADTQPESQQGRQDPGNRTSRSDSSQKDPALVAAVTLGASIPPAAGSGGGESLHSYQLSQWFGGSTGSVADSSSVRVQGIEEGARDAGSSKGGGASDLADVASHGAAGIAAAGAAAGASAPGSVYERGSAAFAGFEGTGSGPASAPGGWPWPHGPSANTLIAADRPGSKAALLVGEPSLTYPTAGAQTGGADRSTASDPGFVTGEMGELPRGAGWGLPSAASAPGAFAFSSPAVNFVDPAARQQFSQETPCHLAAFGVPAVEGGGCKVGHTAVGGSTGAVSAPGSLYQHGKELPAAVGAVSCAAASAPGGYPSPAAASYAGTTPAAQEAATAEGMGGGYPSCFPAEGVTGTGDAAAAVEITKAGGAGARGYSTGRLAASAPGEISLGTGEEQASVAKPAASAPGGYPGSHLQGATQPATPAAAAAPTVAASSSTGVVTVVPVAPAAEGAGPLVATQPPAAAPARAAASSARAAIVPSAAAEAVGLLVVNSASQLAAAGGAAGGSNMLSASASGCVSGDSQAPLSGVLQVPGATSAPGGYPSFSPSPHLPAAAAAGQPAASASGGYALDPTQHSTTTVTATAAAGQPAHSAPGGYPTASPSPCGTAAAAATHIIPAASAPGRYPTSPPSPYMATAAAASAPGGYPTASPSPYMAAVAASQAAAPAIHHPSTKSSESAPASHTMTAAAPTAATVSAAGGATPGPAPASGHGGTCVVEEGEMSTPAPVLRGVRPAAWTAPEVLAAAAELTTPLLVNSSSAVLELTEAWRVEAAQTEGRWKQLLQDFEGVGDSPGSEAGEKLGVGVGVLGVGVGRRGVPAGGVGVELGSSTEHEVVRSDVGEGTGYVKGVGGGIPRPEGRLMLAGGIQATGGVVVGTKGGDSKSGGGTEAGWEEALPSQHGMGEYGRAGSQSASWESRELLAEWAGMEDHPTAAAAGGGAAAATRTGDGGGLPSASKPSVMGGQQGLEVGAGNGRVESQSLGGLDLDVNGGPSATLTETAATLWHSEASFGRASPKGMAQSVPELPLPAAVAGAVANTVVQSAPMAAVAVAVAPVAAAAAVGDAVAVASPLGGVVTGKQPSNSSRAAGGGQGQQGGAGGAGECSPLRPIAFDFSAVASSGSDAGEASPVPFQGAWESGEPTLAVTATPAAAAAPAGGVTETGLSPPTSMAGAAAAGCKSAVSTVTAAQGGGLRRAGKAVVTPQPSRGSGSGVIAEAAGLEEHMRALQQRLATASGDGGGQLHAAAVIGGRAVRSSGEGRGDSSSSKGWASGPGTARVDSAVPPKDAGGGVHGRGSSEDGKAWVPAGKAFEGRTPIWGVPASKTRPGDSTGHGFATADGYWQGQRQRVGDWAVREKGLGWDGAGGREGQQEGFSAPWQEQRQQYHQQQQPGVVGEVGDGGGVVDDEFSRQMSQLKVIQQRLALIKSRHQGGGGGGGSYPSGTVVHAAAEAGATAEQQEGAGAASKARAASARLGSLAERGEGASGATTAATWDAWVGASHGDYSRLNLRGGVGTGREGGVLNSEPAAREGVGTSALEAAAPNASAAGGSGGGGGLGSEWLQSSPLQNLLQRSSPLDELAARLANLQQQLKGDGEDAAVGARPGEKGTHVFPNSSISKSGRWLGAKEAFPVTPRSEYGGMESFREGLHVDRWEAEGDRAGGMGLRDGMNERLRLQRQPEGSSGNWKDAAGGGVRTPTAAGGASSNSQGNVGGWYSSSTSSSWRGGEGSGNGSITARMRAATAASAATCAPAAGAGLAAAGLGLTSDMRWTSPYSGARAANVLILQQAGKQPQHGVSGDSVDQRLGVDQSQGWFDQRLDEHLSKVSSMLSQHSKNHLDHLQGCTGSSSSALQQRLLLMHNTPSIKIRPQAAAAAVMETAGERRASEHRGGQHFARTYADLKVGVSSAAAAASGGGGGGSNASLRWGLSTPATATAGGGDGRVGVNSGFREPLTGVSGGRDPSPVWARLKATTAAFGDVASGGGGQFRAEDNSKASAIAAALAAARAGARPPSPKVLQKWVREGSPKRQRQQRAAEDLVRGDYQQQLEQGGFTGGWSDRFGASGMASSAVDGSRGGLKGDWDGAGHNVLVMGEGSVAFSQQRGGVRGGVGDERQMVGVGTMMNVAVAADALQAVAVAEARGNAALASTSGIGSPSKMIREERFRAAISGCGLSS